MDYGEEHLIEAYLIFVTGTTIFLSGVQFSSLNMKMVHVFYKRCEFTENVQCMIFMV